MNNLGKDRAWWHLQHCRCRVTGHGRTVPPHTACAVLCLPWSHSRLFPGRIAWMSGSEAGWYLWAWALKQPLPERARLLVLTMFNASHPSVLMYFKGVFMVLYPLWGLGFRHLTALWLWAPSLSTPCSFHPAVPGVSFLWALGKLSLSAGEQQCTEQLARLKHLPEAICL